MSGEIPLYCEKNGNIEGEKRSRTRERVSILWKKMKYRCAREATCQEKSPLYCEKNGNIGVKRRSEASEGTSIL